MNLGTFGAALREIEPGAAKDFFTFCDKEFVVHGDIPAMLMLQLGAAVSEKISDTEGMAAMWEAFRCSLTKPEHKDGDKVIPADGAQFGQFYKLAVDRYVDLEELMRLAMALFETLSGRPTEQLSNSPGGQLPVSTNSNGSSSTPQGLDRLRPVDEVLAG